VARAEGSVRAPNEVQAANDASLSMEEQLAIS